MKRIKIPSESTKVQAKGGLSIKTKNVKIYFNFDNLTLITNDQVNMVFSSNIHLKLTSFMEKKNGFVVSLCENYSKWLKGFFMHVPFLIYAYQNYPFMFNIYQIFLFNLDFNERLVNIIIYERVT